MTINFDEFQKLEIKIGKVLSAEGVEGAHKLFKLEVDFGNETRQIVAGLKNFYEPENFIGKSFPFLVNLEPRML
ncbi:MAG: methionine--tRNA ligase, partial [Candidatus Aenigmarchaeota archaeon]|nr:methionine--tRNA ligase [Candidatus Aenigmarchaeota archaeon]